MRVAIFGDIHGNLEAFQAVLYDIALMECSRFVCTGDIVGYGANPSECVAMIREMSCPVVRGNHDEEASLNTSTDGLNPLAAEVLRWTRKQLSDEDRQWLGALPLIYRDEESDFSAAHATFDSPSGWAYLVNRLDAMASFAYQSTHLGFVGHDHMPKIYSKGGGVEMEEETTIQIVPEKKYLVNVGSVGQSRDGDWRAAYGIYDTEARTATIRRVEYDRDAFRQKIIDSGFPELW